MKPIWKLCCCAGSSGPSVPPAADSCEMECGTFTSPASVTPQTQVISLSITGTPKAIIIWTTQQTAAGVASKCLFGIGMATSSTNRGTVATNEDKDVTLEADRSHTPSGVIITTEGVFADAAEVIEKGDIDSKADGEFTIDWETTSSDAIRYKYLAIAGDNVEANVVQFVGETVDQTSQDINHGLSGAPTCWFGIGSHGDNIANGEGSESEGAGISSMSVFASDFTRERWTGFDNAEQGVTGMAQEEKALGHAYIGFRPEEATITAVDATKITLLWTTQSAVAEFYYALFLRGVTAEVGTFTTPATAEDKVVNLSINPKLFIPWGFMDVSAVGTQVDSQLCFGASDGTNDVCNGVLVDDTTENTDRFDSSTKCLAVYDHTQSLQEDASATISGSDVTLTFSNAVAAEYEFNYLALGCTGDAATLCYYTAYDGVGDFYNLPGAFITAGATITTLSGAVWVRVQSGFSGGMLFGESGAGGDTERGWSFSLASDGTIRVLASDDGTNKFWQSATGQISLNTWTHLQFSYSSGTIVVKKNGVAVAQDSSTVPVTITRRDEFAIAARATGSTPEGLSTADISRIVIEEAVWSDQTKAEVKAGTIPAGAYYFPDGNGTETQQALAAMTENGDPTKTMIACATFVTANPYLTLNGTDNRVDVDGIPFSGTSHTFACRYFAASGGGVRQYLFDALGARWVCSNKQNAKISMFDGTWKEFGTAVEDDAWHSLVFAVNGTVVDCYLDGVQSGTQLACSAIVPGDASSAMSLGSSHSGGTDWLKGGLSHVVFSNTAWSAAEALAYHASNTVPAGAIAKYKLCEGTGVVANDSVGSIDGTIVGTTTSVWDNTQTVYDCT